MHDFGIIIHEVHDLWKYKSDLIDAGKLLKNSVVSCNSLKTKEIKIDFGGKCVQGHSAWKWPICWSVFKGLIFKKMNHITTTIM